MNSFATINSQLNTQMTGFLKTPVIMRGLLHLLLLLYVTKLAPSLPVEISVLFENQYFKLFILTIVVWTADVSPITSLLIALGFIVSINYLTKKQLWEYLDNVEDISVTTSPSKQVAMDVVSETLGAQETSTPVVIGMAQKGETVIIQPSVVSTPEGNAVINPTVVVSPMVVETPQGEKIIVTPEVTTVAQSNVAPEVVAQKLDEVYGDKIQETTPAPAQEDSGCYPVKRYDLSKLKTYDEVSNFSKFSV